MRKKLIAWCLASTLTLGCGFSLAAAPVEEAHEYIPAADQEDSTGEDAAQPIEAKQPSHGFSLAKLPRAKWHDYSNDSSPQKVHVALAEGLGPARDSTTINMSEEQRLLYVIELPAAFAPGLLEQATSAVAATGNTNPHSTIFFQCIFHSSCTPKCLNCDPVYHAQATQPTP